jgi:Uma2 family endonuclease
VGTPMTPLDPGFRPPPRGEDLPHTDGEPMETARHRDQMNLLISTLVDAWRDREDYYVAGNMFVYFSELHAKRKDLRGPDVFVVMDTVKRERKSWVVWEEEGRTPDVVIELTSPSTEHVDRGEKMRIYARLLRVAEYYLFDPFTGRLEGYQLDPSSRAYRERTPDAQGRLPSPVTGLVLGVAPGRYNDIEADWLRWMTPDGAVLPTGQERAEREAERAEREAERAEREAERAEREAERAEREAERADAALRRVAELEAQAKRR